MRIESFNEVPPKLDRPVATGAAASVKVEDDVHSIEPVRPVSEVVEVSESRTTASDDRSETVWLDRRAVYRVIDASSGKVVSQIPSDEVLRVSHNIGQLLSDQQTASVDVES